MEVVLAAIKAAILSCKEELATIALEEENAQVYLHGLAKRKLKLTGDLIELEAHLEPPRKETRRVPYLLNAEEAAAYIGITRQWLGHLVRTGQLPAHRGSRRRYLFAQKDLAEFKRSYPTDTRPLPTKGA